MAVAAVIVFGVVASRSPSDDPRAGSRPIGEGPPVVVVRTPAAYEIVYRETVAGPAGEVRVATQVLGVRRPFDSRRETRAGAPPGGAHLGVHISTVTATMVAPAGEDPVVLAVAPGTAPFDVRVDASLGHLVEAGGLERRERRQVAGRICQVYRSQGSLDTTITALVPGSSTYTDTCIDEAGLVLEQLSVDGGETTLRRVAISVGEAPSFGDEHFAVAATPTIPVSRGGGVVARLDPRSPTIAVTWSLPASPGGFTFDGRYAAASPEGVSAAGQPTGERTGAIFDVYTRGPDYVAVEEGGSLGGGIPFAPSALGTVVEVAPGTAEVVPGTRASEVRIVVADRYLRVVGTISPDELVGLARRLEPSPQG